MWTRARDAGAWTEYDKRNYGIADDMLSFGLLCLYAVLTAFSSKDALDGPRLYRLVQTTFDSDLMQFRDYCREDSEFDAAVAFLDMGDKVGWELIQALVQLDWKSRPTAVSCLNHPFLNGNAIWRSGNGREPTEATTECSFPGHGHRSNAHQDW